MKAENVTVKIPRSLYERYEKRKRVVGIPINRQIVNALKKDLKA